ncbi:MFS transporter [Streptomyces barringtoniae]|uniref:MFS transporter n=1 Tax=Streptomyces barringtoniae TaxID=2892029 RepID=UPI003556D87C
MAGVAVRSSRTRWSCGWTFCRPRRRVRVVGLPASWKIGGLTLANVIGVPVGSFAGRLTGWRGPFWALAALAGLAAVFIGRFVPAREQRSGVSLRAEVRALLQGRLWLALSAVTFIMGGVLATYSYISPLLTERAGVPEGAVPAVESPPAQSREPGADTGPAGRPVTRLSPPPGQSYSPRPRTPPECVPLPVSPSSCPA